MVARTLTCSSPCGFLTLCDVATGLIFLTSATKLFKGEAGSLIIKDDGNKTELRREVVSTPSHGGVVDCIMASRILGRIFYAASPATLSPLLLELSSDHTAQAGRKLAILPQLFQ